MSMSETSLPPQWAETPLDEIADIQGGIQKGKKRSSSLPLRDVPYLRVANVQRGYLDLDVVQTIQATEDEISQLRLQAGDVLFNEGGDRDKLGRGWIWSGAISECIHQNHVFRARIIDRILDPKLLSWYGNTVGQQYFFDEGKQTTNLASLNSTKLKALPVLVPPQAEQVRIVEAIESYLSRLDDALATLERVQRNLKRYRASVLKAAVEGRLVPTEAELARADGREYEPASVLLERILAERRRRWEQAELAKMKARGKVPKNDKWKAKYVEPVEPDTSELPELPEGWCWATVDSLAWDGGYGTSRKCQPNGDGPPVLRIPNVQNETLTFEDLKFATGSEPLSTDGILAPGDFIFIRTNGSKRLIGRGALVLNLLPGDYHFASYLIRLRLASTLMTAKWFALVWHAPVVREQVLRDAASSAGQHNVSLSAAQSYCVPLPPHAEQERILAGVERLASIAESSRSIVQPSIARVARLRQSILKWAFEGRLVDQDPTDEPAEVLLARIRAERAAQPVRARRRRA